MLSEGVSYHVTIARYRDGGVATIESDGFPSGELHKALAWVMSEARLTGWLTERPEPKENDQ